MHTQPYAQWSGIDFTAQNNVMELATVLVAGLAVGWFAPGCAFRVAFYGWMLLSGFFYAEQVALFWRDIVSFHDGRFYQKVGPFLTEIPLAAPLTMLASFVLQCGVAYLVSAYRRGTLYRLCRADFRVPVLPALWQGLARKK